MEATIDAIFPAGRFDKFLMLIDGNRQMYDFMGSYVYFPLYKISDIKETLSAKSPVDFSLTTTFKITGRLKNAYAPREGEIISEFKDHIIVSNKKEDKDELFKRLLKYGSFCEILYPKSDREKFKTLVTGLISNFS